MSWDLRLSKLASKQFERLPRDRRAKLGEAFGKMSINPTSGDVRPIKVGKFQGALRRRVGHYRIIFSLDPANRLVEIAAILYRTDMTYD